MAPVQEAVLDPDGLAALVAALWAQGRRVLGPVVRDGAVALGELRSAADLPRGWHDVQAPGSYRLEQRGDDELFGWAVGPQSVKPELFPPSSTVWRARLRDGVPAIEEVTDDDPAREPGADGAEGGALALVGVRPCELAALDVLDAALGAASAPDPRYRRRRAGALLVAVECGSPSGTCFCASMGTGPGASGDADLVLTELHHGGHRFLARAGSPRGAAVLAAVPHRDARDADRAERDAVLARAARSMGRALDTDGLPALLERNIDHPRWDDVAARCLSCGNCTSVCPTCFCSTVEDVSLLDGTVERHRDWASCFDLAHSFLHGGAVRPSARARYRQWLTHKLSTWWDQFGMSGCVGCGRCITWCPVGIDLTEEAAAIRRADGVAAGEREA